MFERDKAGEQSLDLQIGGKAIRLITKTSDVYLLYLVKKYLGTYCVATNKTACNIKIIPFAYVYKHPWATDELERFRRFFLEVHGRYPSDIQPDRIGLSLRLLQYMDPGDKSIQHICQMIHGQKLTYARVGMDLFFFNTESKTAYLFVGETFRRLPLIKWIMKIFDMGQSTIRTGILNGIMFVLSHLLIYDQGLLLHGSALQKDGHGFLFLGLSGAGKSTITQLVGPDVCFSDDGVVVKKEMDTVFVYHSPFKQTKGFGKERDMVKTKIQKAFLLEKADQNRALPLKKSELMDSILKHMIHFYKFMDRDTAQKGFYIVKDIVESLPVYKLQFSKRQDIWNNAILSSGSEVNHAG